MLPPGVASELLLMYLAKGIRATTAIEGNTLTEHQVRERISKGPKEPIPRSQEYQAREVDNIIAACNEIADEIVNGEDCRLTVARICKYNSQVLSGLPLEEGVIPGKLRHHSVGVGRYRGAPARDCEFLLGRMCEWINDKLAPPKDEDRIAFGILRAIMAHLYIAWIHPFGDGNGRTARLIEFQLMLSAGVPALSAHLLSNHYNQTRPEYYRHLDEARRSPLAFIDYALVGLVDKLDLQIKRIRKHQYAVTWKDHVYEQFRNHKTPAAHRQRILAIALGPRKSPVSTAEIETLTRDLAKEYAGKTRKTVNRDLNELHRRGLVVKRGRRWIANRVKLLSFLPGRRDKNKWM